MMNRTLNPLQVIKDWESFVSAELKQQLLMPSLVWRPRRRNPHQPPADTEGEHQREKTESAMIY